MPGDRTPLELVCPAGTPAAFRAAVNAGADSVYVGFRDETNARNFPGLNFSRAELRQALAFAHERGRKVYVAVNTFPAAGNPRPWRAAVDDAAEAGADAIIVADIGLLEYAAHAHPATRRHLSVQASASNAVAIRYYGDTFGVKRVVLPRVLSVADIARLKQRVAMEFEVFAFGSLCVMAEGRCLLSGYATGHSPNTDGVCSPASHVRYERKGRTLVSRLGGFTIYALPDGAPAGYPTLCKGRFVAAGRASYLFEEPVSLNAAGLLPELSAAGVTALKIEGRQRGRAYVAKVAAAFRLAIDAVARGEAPPPIELNAMTEGHRNTTGAYASSWR